MWMFLLVAAILIATYLLLPAPPDEDIKKAGLDEFDYPTNNNERVIPVLYGCVWMHGNCLEYQNLVSKEITT